MGLEKILGLISGLGESWGTGAINAGFTNRLNEKNAALNQYYWDIQAQKQFQLNERSADNAMKRTINMYNLLQSPSAMVKQLREAGLNPALMYSQGGMGGSVQSGPQGQGTNPTGAPTLGLQQVLDPLTIAQIKNINADTKKKEEETENTKFDSMLKDSMTKLNDSQTKLNNLDFDFKDSTFWSRYNETYYNMLKLQGEAQEAIADGTLAQESYEDRLANYALQNLRTNTEIALLKSKKDLNDAEKEVALVEARKMTEEILYIQARTGYYEERKELTKSEIRLTEEQAEKIMRSYSWKYFTKDDVFKAWENLNGSAEAVAEFIPLTRFWELVTETITIDSKGNKTTTYSRKRPPINN